MSRANSRALPGPQLLDFTCLVVCATAGFRAYRHGGNALSSLLARRFRSRADLGLRVVALVTS
jgi:hypothetical protein